MPVELLKPAEQSAGGGGVWWIRAWACLLAVALALSLAPGTAAAQTTPPQVVSVTLDLVINPGFTAIAIQFDKGVDGGNKHHFTVVVDGKKQEIVAVSGGVDGLIRLVASGSPPEGAVVTVSYSVTVPEGKPSSTLELLNNPAVEVESFRWNVNTNMRLPTVYEALEDYFSGTATLSVVEGVISEVDGKTYHQKLTEEVVSGRLDRRFDTDERSVVGTDATAGWHQVGTPSVRPGPDDTCGGTTVPGGEGGFETHVSSRYYWNCTQDGQWVPVKVPEPGVDYAADEDLLRPDQPGYNPDCRHRDQDGNPATTSRFVVTGYRVVRTYVWTDDSGEQVTEEIREPVGHFVESSGNSWDPIAKQCTTRGNP